MIVKLHLLQHGGPAIWLYIMEARWNIQHLFHYSFTDVQIRKNKRYIELLCSFPSIEYWFQAKCESSVFPETLLDWMS